jgi:hypothetical protein
MFFMKKLAWYSLLVLLLTITLFSLLIISPERILSADQASGKLEILIKNFKYEYQGGVLNPNEAATIILRNADKVRHGFTSPLLETLDLRVETETGISYGKGIRGVYIEPGGMVRLEFIPKQPGKFTFQCDLHPSMKGELLLLSIGAI